MLLVDYAPEGSGWVEEGLVVIGPWTGGRRAMGSEVVGAQMRAGPV